MSEWKIVTLWYRDDEYNHLDDGYDANKKEPTPKCDDQRKAWKNGKWTSRQGLMTEQFEVLTKVKHEHGTETSNSNS